MSSTKYFLTEKTVWYWMTIALAVATVIAVLLIPENAYPIVYIRYLFGSIFILWLPGYTFIKALFPTQIPTKTSTENADLIERVTLSVVMSLAFAAIVGLILNYTPWGIRPAPVTSSLPGLSVTFATVAVMREQSKDTTSAK